MEADDHEQDSAFVGDRTSLASSSTSIKSSVTRYEYLHGRRYHNFQAGEYHFPNDEQELDRMDLEHHNMKLQLDGKLFACPLVDDPREILDLGTGTGIWCIEMADAYPDAQILGTDLSPTQPTWVPPNCRFEIDDFTQPWTFGHNRFDMIHHRYTTGNVKDNVQFYRNAYNALKPGGSLEAVEIEFGWYSDDNTLPADSALKQWADQLHEAFDKIGAGLCGPDQYVEFFKTAGFENVELQILKRPSNDWPKDARMKEIGKYCCLNWLEGQHGFTLAPLTRVLGWKHEEVQVLMAKMRKECVSRNIHAYMKGFIVYGTKPLEPTG